MQMPGMDGMQLACEIKGDPLVSSTRLILLTSVGHRGDGDEARRAGLEAYLTKPVRQSELRDVLVAVMDSPGEASPEMGDRRIARHTSREVQPGAHLHVLLAEDNAVNQSVAARMLEGLGYRVDVADDGLEALEAIERNRYAAVLMDVQMPGLDGHAATAEIRRRERAASGSGDASGSRRRVPIIAMTANALTDDRERALAAGMDDFVPKPVKQEALGEILERWVGRTPQPDGPQEEPVGDSAGDGVLDPEVLAGLRKLGGAGLFRELCEVFLGDAEARLEALKEAAEVGDAETVERTAHTLKGSAGNMGARKMAETCTRLQDAASAGDLSGVPVLLEQLRKDYGRVRPALEAEAAEEEASEA